MRNIKLTISYDGTNYRGWQIQKSGVTIQSEIEIAIKKVFGAPHKLCGASRTDSGVHAYGQAANFKTDSPMPVGKIALALNAALPEDIVVLDAKDVPSEFHARFDAKSKMYRYHIRNSKVRDPFGEKYSWRVPYRLNVALMRREACILEGRHDFKSFQAVDKKERSSTRDIFSVHVKKRKEDVIVEIEGNGFLYNMVRVIAGTLVDLGRGYFPEGSMKKILAARDRTKAGPTAPAKGLFLVRVKY